MIEESNTTKYREEQHINIVDLIRHFWYNWEWFALSLLIFVGYFYYKYSKTPFIYERSEIVMVKTSMNTPVTTRLTRSMVNNSKLGSVTDEILQLRSKNLMSRSIKKIGADISYKTRQGLRDIELYKDAPVQVKFLDRPSEYSCSFTLNVSAKNYVTIRDWNGNNKTSEIRIELNTRTKTPIGEILITPTYYYNNYIKKEIGITKMSLRHAAEHFSSGLSVAQMEKEASLIRISIRDLSKERASDLLTTMVEEYNEIYIQDKNKIAVVTAELIKDRLEILEEELGSVESEVESMLVENDGLDAKSMREVYMNEKKAYKTEMLQIDTEIKLVDMMNDYLRESSENKQLIPINIGIKEENFQQQILEYNRALIVRNRFAEEGHNISNPIIVDLDARLASMRGNIGKTIKEHLKFLENKKRDIINEDNKAQEYILQIPGRQRETRYFDRQHKVKEELYMYLLSRQEENAINKATTEETLRVIDPPMGSNSHISPILFKKMTTGLAIGFVLPAFVMVIVISLNNSIRTRHDLEKVLSIPFLGEIPFAKIKSKDISKSSMMVSNTGVDSLTEAFRIFRTNISFMAKDNVPPKVLVYTSLDIGAGKTFNAINLAGILSHLDKKIVVVDLDLRKGTLSSRLDILHEKGISHYLSDTSVSISEILCKIPDMENIDVIPIGAIAPNPVELLLSNRLDQLFEKLRKHYDYIVVDGVPVGIIADSSVIDRISDLSLFVIRSGMVSKKQLPTIEKLYKDKKISNMAVVLNGVKIRGKRYGYSYGYGYGYGYGGNNKNEIKKKSFVSKILCKIF